MRKNICLILLGLIILVVSKKTKFTTEIKITSNDDKEKENEKEIEKETDLQKNNTSTDSEEEPEQEKEKEKEEEIIKEKEVEKEPIRETKKIQKTISEDKYTIIEAPYQDNEDYIITPVGFGTPVNFVPLQIETTSYKSWIISSTLNQKSSLVFSYDKASSKTVEDPGDWDTVVD